MRTRLRLHAEMSKMSRNCNVVYSTLLRCGQVLTVKLISVSFFLSLMYVVLLYMYVYKLHYVNEQIAPIDAWTGMPSFLQSEVSEFPSDDPFTDSN